MKYLVTGGAGFIGSNICLLLLEHRHDFTVLDNLMSGHEANLHGLKVKFARGDVRDSLADISKAQNEFGFAPTVTMGPGLPEYVRWARANMEIPVAEGGAR